MIRNKLQGEIDAVVIRCSEDEVSEINLHNYFQNIIISTPTNIFSARKKGCCIPHSASEGPASQIKKGTWENHVYDVKK